MHPWNKNIFLFFYSFPLFPNVCKMLILALKENSAKKSFSSFVSLKSFKFLEILDRCELHSTMIAYLDDLTILQNNALHKTKHCVTIKCEALSSAFIQTF